MTVIVAFLIGVASSVVAAIVLASTQRWKHRMSFRSVLAAIEALHRDIEADGFVPEYIVTVDRNSGVAGSILAGHLGLAAVISVSTINRRTPDGTRQVELDSVHATALTQLGGKRTLVFLCCNDSGLSLRRVVGELTESETPPSEIRTAALYTSISPALRPQYFAFMAGRDFRLTMPQVLERLPWVTKGWKLQLAAERRVSE